MTAQATAQATNTDARDVAAAEMLTEDERAYFLRTFDARRAATEAASAAVEELGRAEGANASYRDYLWEKYGLGPADAINAESGIIARHGG